MFAYKYGVTCLLVVCKLINLLRELTVQVPTSVKEKKNSVSETRLIFMSSNEIGTRLFKNDKMTFK